MALGLVLSGAIGALAYWRGMLSASGVFGAVLIGTTVFGFGGWVPGLTLIAFFASSSALSHYRERQKDALAETFSKGHRRDLGQALANGAAAALIAMLAGLTGANLLSRSALAFAFCGALATVTADTWATEVGVLSRSRPVLIISLIRLTRSGRTREPVPTGTSGGVTLLGFSAALAGAVLIGLVFFLLSQGMVLLTAGAEPWQNWEIVPVAVVSGFVGAAFDSMLGATRQAMYYCEACAAETERRVHRCGKPTRQTRGWGWLNNDWVNLLSSVVGGGVGALLGIFLA